MRKAHHLTAVGGVALVRAIGSKICSFHFVCLLSTHEFKWYTKTLWPNGMKIWFGIYLYLKS